MKKIVVFMVFIILLTSACSIKKNEVTANECFTVIDATCDIVNALSISRMITVMRFLFITYSKTQ